MVEEAFQFGAVNKASSLGCLNFEYYAFLQHITVPISNSGQSSRGSIPIHYTGGVKVCTVV